MQESWYYLGFAVFPGIGTRRFEKLVARFGSAENAWKGESSKLLEIVGQHIGKRFLDFRNQFDLQACARTLQEKKIHFFVPTEKEYPKFLKALDHPPFILFAKGNISLLQDDRPLGIVGTRKVTEYGRQVTEMFVADLVQKDFVIVSGMALGVDAIAHTTAIKNKGKTIAVLGSGVDYPTPREHEQLYQEILTNNGAVVSTFCPGEGAHVGSFPARNATIAGLSLGILVTEGAEGSGALITAKDAQNIHRPVFAVPGQITSALSKGTNNLIKSGAIAVSSASDIIEHLGYSSSEQRESRSLIDGSQQARTRKGDTKEEQAILALLENGPLHFDDIVRKIGKDSKDVGSLLSVMELKGMIQSLSNGQYNVSN